MRTPFGKVFFSYEREEVHYAAPSKIFALRGCTRVDRRSRWPRAEGPQLIDFTEARSSLLPCALAGGVVRVKQRRLGAQRWTDNRLDAKHFPAMRQTRGDARTPRAGAPGCWTSPVGAKRLFDNNTMLPKKIVYVV
jgi:hypothetical protein